MELPLCYIADLPLPILLPTSMLMTNQKSFYQIKLEANSTEEFIEWMKQNKEAWNDVNRWFNFTSGFDSIQEAIDDDEWFNDWSNETDWTTNVANEGSSCYSQDDL